jgi:peptidoglycan/LPS O-acetylase OafA/YrhL
MNNIKGRLYELDSIRGLTALAVVLFHYSTMYQVAFKHVKEPYYLDFKYGHLGVQLFFMISGFVIYMTLTKCKGTKDYIIKRSIRLYPAYIFAVILTFTIVNVYGRMEEIKPPFVHGLINLTMFQEFVPGIRLVDGSYWTLRVELTFYILMFFILLLGLTKKIEILSILWLTTSALIKLISMNTDHKLIQLLGNYGITDYCHLFIAGIMFYLLKEKGELKHHLIIGLCLIYNVVFLDNVSSIFATAFFVVFYALTYGKLSFLNTKPLIFIGTISYSLYLVHQNIGYVIIDILERNGFVHEVFILVPIAVSVGIATIMTFYIEKPIQKYLRKKYISKQAIKPVNEKVAV